ncbi:adenylate kinase [Actinoplanes sp. NPDC049548]|uniref:adenylate kinase n=1 Tax=Actinoplanes sp. NPDC049548 TaxID=3155152 RepID=UPI00343E1EFB
MAYTAGHADRGRRPYNGMSAPPARILVYGVTGAGKTTLARRIGERFGLPWHSVDDLTWEPGWVQVPVEVQRARIAAVCAQERWVLDHAYGAWLDLPLSRADLVIGLDFPRWLSLGRLVRRTVVRMVRRERVCNGNVESLRVTLSRESIIVWHFQSFARKRQRMRAWTADPYMPAVLLFRRPSEVEAWLEHSLKTS